MESAPAQIQPGDRQSIAGTLWMILGVLGTLGGVLIARLAPATFLLGAMLVIVTSIVSMGFGVFKFMHQHHRHALWIVTVVVVVSLLIMLDGTFRWI